MTSTSVPSSSSGTSTGRVNRTPNSTTASGGAGPGGHRPAGQRHREHAVRDHAGQADLGGDPVAPVDRVEVAGRARVADQVGPGHPVRLRGQLVPTSHVSPPPARRAWTRRVTTGSPATVRDVGAGGEEVVPAPGRDLLDRVHADQLVAGDDRAGVREALVAVHHPAVVQAQRRVVDDLPAGRAW